MDIKGHTVHKVMLAETADIEEEYYFSYLLDRANRTFLCIASVAGGMDIEQVADQHPDKVAKMAIDAIKGVDEAKAREIVAAASPGRGRRPGRRHRGEALAGVRRRGRHAGRGQPARQVGDGQVLCLDAKVTLDENAGVPAPGPRGAGRPGRGGPAGAGAKAKNLNYVKLDSDVGIIGNGAGLVMSTLDVVAYAGEGHGSVKPANFLDIGGGASA